MARVYAPDERLVTPTTGPWIASAAGPMIILLVGLIAFFAIIRLSPPAAVANTAPASDFSSARAMEKLAPIVQAPHPIGSAENMRVRDYLMSELSALGLNPQVQRATGINQKRRNPVPAGVVENIVGRLPGTNSSRAILMVAHYDSVPTGTGTADDGASVAALLETARALKSSQALKNDVIFLLTDGEEVGMLGAIAFAERHPWSKDVGMVMNFEALGTSGPTVMFETSNNNGWLIREFARGADRPVANSLTYELYKVLPFDTDMSVFKAGGLPGLNFASIVGAVNHHIETDNVSNLDERSLQHQGSSAVSLARHFGNLDLTNTSASNAVYFDLLSATLVHYPVGWVIPLCVIVLLIFIGVTILGFRKKQLTFKGFALGFLAFLINLTIVPVIIWLAWTVIKSVYPAYRALPQGGTYNGGYYMLSFVALAIGITALLYILFRKKISMLNLLMGGLLCWLLLMVVTSLYMPGASYIFMWPLLFVLLGLAYVFASGPPETVTGKRFGVLFLSAIPGIIILAPLVYLVSTGMGLGVAPVVMVLVVLLLGLLIPHFSYIQSSNKWVVPACAILVSIGFIAAGSFTAGFDDKHPKPNHLFYALSADSNQAVWGSLDGAADAWSSQALSAAPERGGLSDYFPSSYGAFLKKPAPVTALAAPNVELKEENVSDGIRTVRVLVTSARLAPILSIYAYSGGEIVEAAIDGQQINRVFGDRVSINYYAPPKEGTEITLKMRSVEPVRIRVMDMSYGLPEGAVSKRPNGLMPAPLIYSDQTLVSKSFKI